MRRSAADTEWIVNLWKDDPDVAVSESNGETPSRLIRVCRLSLHVSDHVVCLIGRRVLQFGRSISASARDRRLTLPQGFDQDPEAETIDRDPKIFVGLNVV